MNIEAMKAELLELNKQAEAIGKRRMELKLQIAKAQAAFNVGDRVTHDGATCVWQITSIAPGWGNEPKYYGAKLKKDGTPGKLSNTIWVPYDKPLRAA